MRRLSSIVGFLWGLAGVQFILLSAVVGLTPLALDAFDFTFQWYHWVLLVANVVFMAWSEGYKGFQLAFSPRVAGRLRWLYDNPSPQRVLLAPLFVMSFFEAPLRRRIVVIVMPLAIMCLIILVRLLDQPWRGIADAGVVVGLSYGSLTVLWFTVKAMAEAEPSFCPELGD